jgi:uncharacterized protein (TIGR03437 family)
MCPAAKFGLALSLLFVTATGSLLAVDLSMPAQVAGRGGSIMVPIFFVSQGAYVRGLQFDLVFDPDGLRLSAVVGDSIRSSDKTLYFAPAEPGRSRILITQLNQNVISDGNIVNLFVSISPALGPGFYYIHLDATVAAGPGGKAVPVTTIDGSINVRPINGPSVLSEGVLNAANLLPGPVAPGEIITILGSAIGTPASPESTKISFDDIASPLVYTSFDQINAVVPFGIDGRSVTTLEIVNPSGQPTRISVPVAPSAPGIFTLNATGTGQGAILNQDGTVNSPDNPAQVGSIIVFFATGAGQTNPPGNDGLIPMAVLPMPRLPVSVQIDYVDSEILYAGAAPGLISGVVQVNCRVPTGVKPGNSLPVLLTVGDVTSEPVTVAIK